MKSEFELACLDELDPCRRSLGRTGLKTKERKRRKARGGSGQRKIREGNVR